MASKEYDLEERSAKIPPHEFIRVVNCCLDSYYGDPRSRFGTAYNPSSFSGKSMSEQDIEEFTRSRNFVCIFEDLQIANHFHQAIQFLSNVLVYHIPPANVIQKILDLMLVIDDEEYVIEAQAYLHQLITCYPPNCDALGQYYQIVLKEEEIEQKRVSSPKDPCGSFVNVLHQFETELGKIDQKNKNPPSKVSKCDNEEDSNDSSQSEDEEEAANTDDDQNLLNLCDMSLLIGKNFKLWWNNATSEQRIHRLMCVLSIMMEIFELDLIRWKKRTPEAQKHPLARPIISRLIWPYEDHGDPSVMLIKMITSMYSIAHKYDLFHCMTEFERLISFVAAVLPSSPLDKGEGYPPDSHQRRVFAQYISNSLEDCRLEDDVLEIAIARLQPSWLRLVVGSKIHNRRSNRACGDLPVNVAQLTQLIIESLGWGDYPEAADDSDDIDKDVPSSSTASRKKKAVKRNSKGETSLHVSCRTGNTKKLMEALSETGYNINITDYANWTPLHEAVGNGNLECVRILLEYQGDKKSHQMRLREKMSNKSGKETSKTCVNLHAKGGEKAITPLYEAVMRNDVHIADLLLKFGGSKLLYDTTDDGLTPFDIAVSDSMLKVLQSHKKESRIVEKKWIADMTSSAMQLVSTPRIGDCITLRCMLLHAYLQSNCLMEIMQALSQYQKKKQKKKQKKVSKNFVVQNIDYLEYSHDMKALQSFIKCAKSHLNGNITFYEACLLVFLC